MLVAGVQCDVTLKDPARNLKAMLEALRVTAEQGAHLTVFPECVLTGYCFDTLEEARPYAQTIPGPATGLIASACAGTGGYAVFGMLENDGPRIFNAAVLVGPAGVIGSYRKVHLPYLGIDMFTTHGDREFSVHSAGDLRVGMNICYDASFPEGARALSILGADLIVLPTNWPPGAECTAECTINARALENAVYYMAVNRVGTERGFSFIGKSRIADSGGRTIAEAPGNDEQVFYAEIDPAKSRRKHIVRVPGKHEIDRLADRRPEMYGLLTEPHRMKSPGRP